ncbi:MAG: IS630 family transposase [Acidobacteria bacterium]|nr:IS630 family transposase [Acidobacteriota bacterium]
MSRTAASVILSPSEAEILAEWARSRTVPVRLAERARIVQLAAAGMQSQGIARVLGVSRPTVQLWRRRFMALRLPGIEKDAPRPGRTPRISEEKIRQIVEATLHSRPPNATHWSTRLMARAQGVSEVTVRRIWTQHNLKPHLTKSFKLSRDKQFVRKLCDVVGLYLNPPDKSLVLCVDEKPQIQVLDRTRPGLPMKPGRCGTMTHEYKGHGTSTLFAALLTLGGRVIGDCMPRHRHQEFIRFLKKVDGETPPGLDLHLIVDNYATHKHLRVQSWLKRHPRFHMHFTPTSSSWLNVVDRWFRELTQKRLSRGSFSNARPLIAAIQEYLDNHNQNPQVFSWSAPSKRILASINKCKEGLDALH